MIKITDHAVNALSFLLSRYRDSTRIRKLIEIVGDEVQRFENVAYDVLDKRLLDNAEGVTLDRYGGLVQLPRLDTSDDDEYRGLIEAAIAANASNAQADTIAAVALALVAKPVRYIWGGPMHVWLQTECDTAFTASFWTRATDLIIRALGGGVSYVLVVGETTDAIAGTGAFRLDSGPGLDNGKLASIKSWSN